MPTETTYAIHWALSQTTPDGQPVTVDNAHWLVHYVREYFNAHEITYETFSYDDLIQFLPQYRSSAL